MASNLMTMAEVHETWPVFSIPMLRKWRFEKKGPHSFKVGSRVVYKREDVERWIDEQYREGVGA